jgi:PPK2 family polyphosphate:nucleotide phosphotransferase
MDYRKRFLVEPGTKIKLSDIDPGYHGKHLTEEQASRELEAHRKSINKVEDLIYAESRQSLLIVLQAMDAGGKDGTVRHAMSVFNPMSTTVSSFKVPTPEESKHDFLWRVHPHAPARGMVAIFNRSHYEDVLVVRVHNLVPKHVWSKRYDAINEFEGLLHRESHTHILKFFLYISPEEQLERFKQRLDDPERNWKISEDDYKEREFWDDYIQAYEAVFHKTSTKHAPWYIIPANHKWFRNLAVSQIVAATMEELDIETPKPTVDLERIRQQYHAAEEAAAQEPADASARKNRKK